MGLKFDTGADRRNYTDYAVRNHRWSETEGDRGFIQGITACCMALSKSQHKALPRRYVTALEGLGKDNNLVITQADKGGGVVVMDMVMYKDKMLELLNDESTYTRKCNGFALREAEKFNQQTRAILRKTEKGKKLLHLLEEAPRPPFMKGLPKIHKPGIPMRPITSGIGSAPHRLAKVLAKPLSRALGSISDSHLKNSSDLINRIKGIKLRNKKLASFDVKSLFTNVPVEGAINAVKRVVNNLDEDELPLRRSDYIKLVSLCVKFGSFVFDNDEFHQHEGLAMGSPLSAVMACLFMESLEADHFKRIVGPETTWLRYVDDVFIIVPRRRNLEDTLSQLNNVHDRIRFTLEEESGGSLPFLDTVIWKSDEEPKFSVHRKPTNKDDFIHFLSAHNERVKSGVVIGFFLRALRICSSEYLEEEINYITNAFVKLGYPRGLIITLKLKAKKIMDNVGNRMMGTTRKYCMLPNFKQAGVIDKFLSSANLYISHPSGRRIGDIVRHNKKEQSNVNSVVYKIPCGGCDKSYIGESGKGFDVRLNQHKADVRFHRTCNAIVTHIDSEGHLPNWNDGKVLHFGMNKLTRKAVEAAYIVSGKGINVRSGHFTWSDYGAKIMLGEWRTDHRGGDSGEVTSQSERRESRVGPNDQVGIT